MIDDTASLPTVPLLHAPREKLATLTFPRPRCPRCGSARLRKYRSIRDQGDGSALSWVVCGGPNCGHRFRVLLE